MAKTTGTYVTHAGGDKWFFVTSDYTFGQALERDTERAAAAPLSQDLRRRVVKGIPPP